MFLYLLMSTTICLIMMSLYLVISFSSNKLISKVSPFECGFEPLTSTRRPFNVRYFILVVLFLVFDVETVLLFPLVTQSAMNVSMFLNSSVYLFLVMLLFALLYEWYNSMLEWVM